MGIIANALNVTNDHVGNLYNNEFQNNANQRISVVPQKDQPQLNQMNQVPLGLVRNQLNEGGNNVHQKLPGESCLGEHKPQC